MRKSERRFKSSQVQTYRCAGIGGFIARTRGRGSRGGLYSFGRGSRGGRGGMAAGLHGHRTSVDGEISVFLESNFSYFVTKVRSRLRCKPQILNIPGSLTHPVNVTVFRPI